MVGPEPGRADITSGNSTVTRVIRALLVGLFNRFQRANARLLPRLCLIRACKRYPFIEGMATTVSSAQATCTAPALARSIPTGEKPG
jgi:hypothetical protein